MHNTRQIWWIINILKNEKIFKCNRKNIVLNFQIRHGSIITTYKPINRLQWHLNYTLNFPQKINYIETFMQSRNGYQELSLWVDKWQTSLNFIRLNLNTTKFDFFPTQQSLKTTHWYIQNLEIKMNKITKKNLKSSGPRNVA
jgi:hypothetical protein